MGLLNGRNTIMYDMVKVKIFRASSTFVFPEKVLASVSMVWEDEKHAGSNTKLHFTESQNYRII